MTHELGLLSVLFQGEGNCSAASTAMHEQSSRSHTIFCVVVESRPRVVRAGRGSDGGDGTEEDDSDDDELRDGDDGSVEGDAVRVGTLNLVDLAGSESVRHTGATGDRQKEGGKINQSLLTLSRVIGALGRNDGHVNFHDSKLTRILSPSLSGNAHMAVVCCATPSELYLEETRSTLQFAGRAQLVKTRATVNEVLDDRSLIKKLQRELRESRRGDNSGAPGPETAEQMRALEEKVATAEQDGRRADNDLKRMKGLILRGGVLLGGDSTSAPGGRPSLFVYNDGDGTLRAGPDGRAFLGSPSGGDKRPKQRRSFDGLVQQGTDVELASPARLSERSPRPGPPSWRTPSTR